MQILTLPLPHRLTIAAALACSLAGCGATQVRDASGPFADVRLIDPPPSYQGSDLLTPIVGVVSGSTRGLHDAIQNGIDECMSQAGFSYFPVPFPSERPDRNFDDPAWRADNAYGVANLLSAAQPSQQDRNATYIDGLSESQLQAYDVAMFGSDADVVPLTNAAGQETGFYHAGGCLAAALEAEMGYDNGQMQYNLDVVEGRRNDSIDAMEADERWIAIWNEWSACMSAQGWEFASRREAIDHTFEQASGDPETARRLEKQIAESDDDCSLRLGTDQAVWQLRYSYQSAAVDSLAIFLGELSSVEDELSAANRRP